MKKLLVAVAISLLSLSFQAPALAHSSISETIPEYQAMLNSLPEEVSITFSEEPLVISGKEVNSITVINPDGQIISADQTRVLKNRLSVSILSNPTIEGTYSVRYRMASPDGHVVTGNYEFYLGAKSDAVNTVVQKEENSWLEHFFHLHKEHIGLAFASLIPILGWIFWRRQHNLD